MNTGEKIKSARKAQNLTQQELADRIGVNRSAIAKYENDMVKTIPRDIIEKLMNELDLIPADFFDFNTMTITAKTGSGKTGAALNVAKQVMAQQREITDQEEILLFMFKNLSDKSKKIVMDKATQLFNDEKRDFIQMIAKINRAGGIKNNG